MSVGDGLLHDGVGPLESGDATPARPPRREGPGATAGGRSHRVDAEDPVQAHWLPGATAERHGEDHQGDFQTQSEDCIAKCVSLFI